MQSKPWFNPKSFNLFEFTFKVYYANSRTMVLLSTLIVLPVFLHQMVLRPPFEFSINPVIDSLLSIGLSLWGLVPIMGIINISEKYLKHNRAPTLIQALKQGAAHWPTAFFTYFGVGVVLMGIYIPLYVLASGSPLNKPVSLYDIGGLFLYTFIQFIPHTIVLQEDRRRGPIQRIWHLVGDQWWAAFGHTLALGFLVGAVYGILIVILINLTFLNAIGLLIPVLFLAFVLGVPVVFIYQTMLFLMLEARKVAPTIPKHPDTPD